MVVLDDRSRLALARREYISELLIRGRMKRWNSSTISSFFPDQSQGQLQSFPPYQVRPRAELCNPATFHYACLTMAVRQ
jgi:hypothetical protein